MAKQYSDISDLSDDEISGEQAVLDQALASKAALALKDLSPVLGARPIVLVGMMGAGKTTVGRRLAKRMDRTFVDADQEIEAAAGMSISEIFETHGEASFRDGERKVIKRLLKEPGIVLATGGGAYMNADTRNAIAEHGVSIWIKAEFEILMARVRRKSNRPLLQQKNPEAVMRRLIDERYPIYAQADVTVLSKNSPHSVVVSDVIVALDDYLNSLQQSRAHLRPQEQSHD